MTPGRPVPLPGRLLAPTPGWQLRADVVVVGSGLAGLSTALYARAAGLAVTVVTKVGIEDGSTRWAQGGIAAAVGPTDTPEQHLADTLTAGAGLCEEDAVRVLVTEGPQRLRDLIALGARFDRDSRGELELTREGGHHQRRIAHAGGDATGAEIQRALEAAVRALREPGDGAPAITVVEHASVLDLLRGPGGQAAGVTLHVHGQGTPDGVGAVLAPVVILATGGLGQAYAVTTNPPVATGDGVALALRAGAEVADLEFIQFHPTVLYLAGGGRGQVPLISEAMRGEGAVLRDPEGRRFMPALHELAELAPRDVVATAITRVMRRHQSPHVWLDARGLGEVLLRERFPSILARCRAAGIDPVAEPIPVAPAAHYASGGVVTDLSGRTSIPGLYACGEVARTGVHGANRLASNSLLEGVVFAGRIGAELARDGVPPQPDPVVADGRAGLLEPGARRTVQDAMQRGVAMGRTGEGLAGVLRELAGVGAGIVPGARDVKAEPEAWEVTGLHTVATAVATAAATRTESRGSHWREDFPDRDEARLRGRITVRLDPDGNLATDYRARR